MFKLYALADKFGALELMDRLLDKYARAMTKQDLWVNIEEILAAYSCTPEKSPLRSFMCHHVGGYLVTSNDDLDEAPTTQQLQQALKDQPDLVQDIVPLLAGIMGDNYLAAADTSGCKYHSHPNAGLCPLKKIETRKELNAAEEERQDEDVSSSDETEEDE